MSDTGSRITRYYGDFRGIDLRGEECSLVRSPDCLNVWRNYKELASIETRPGLEALYQLPLENEGEKLYRILFFKGKLIAITNFGMYAANDNGTFDMIHDNIREFYKIRFVYAFGDFLYFADRLGYYQYDGTEVKEVSPYVPTTSIGRTPAGEGTTHEDVNMLTIKRSNEFTSDGVATKYYLDARNIAEVTEVYDMENNEVLDAKTYVLDSTFGSVIFGEAPKKSATGHDNIRITFSLVGETQRLKVQNNTQAQVFDNRIFLGGGEDFPNRIWYSKLEAPNYFSDVDYVDDGVDAARIKGMVPGNNALWVFREPSDANTNVFYHVPTIDEDYGKIYPSSHSSVSIGCVGGAINFNDDIVFFSPYGMEGISADITTEQFASHRSSVVDRLMTAHQDYKEMLLVEWQGYLLVIMGKDVYLADSRAVYQNEGHLEYEWYYWDLGINIVSATVHDGMLYLGTDAIVDEATGETTSACAIYSLSYTQPNRADDCFYGGQLNVRSIHSYWTTPKDKFNTPQKTKTTNKRGCVVEAEGDIRVYAKTEDTEYELVGKFTGVKDYFVPRIKQKKFKDLQLKFESKTSFKLENVTIEAVVGGYIKR